MNGQRHAPAALYPRERPGTHCTGSWVGPRAGLYRCGKSRPPLGFDPRTVSARSQSLYRLRYPAQPAVVYLYLKYIHIKFYIVLLTAYNIRDFFFYHEATALLGQGLLIIDDPRLHSDTPHSVGLLWTSDQLVAETST